MSIRLSAIPSILLAFACIAAAQNGEPPDAATTLHHVKTVGVTCPDGLQDQRRGVRDFGRRFHDGDYLPLFYPM